jgi:IS1 family transposase/transposase-like protein
MFYENLVWFCLLWLSVLVARRLWRATHPPTLAAVASPKRKTPRPLKPRTPNDCPVCGRPHPTPIAGNVRQPGVPPWCERKSQRGKPKTICTAGSACPNPKCDYHGNTDSTFHALVGDGKRGADGIQWLKCQACGKRFSSRRGTALYRLRTPAAQVAQVLLAVNLGLTISDTGLLFQHSEMTIRLWLSRAGQHAEKVHVHFFRNLHLGHLQLDELFTTLRDKAHDLWVWVAFDPSTKLIPALHLGPRTQHMAYALLHAVSLVLAPGCLPVFTSDGLDLYFYAITAHFGQWVTDVTSGKTRWQVALNLLYGQVKKSYRRRRLARVERHMRLGDLAHLTDRLKALGFSGTLNTAFVERINLTLRHALAALSRRSWATAQLTGELLAHLEWWRAYYHFCRPHLSLRLQLDGPQARRGKQTPRRYGPHTPAMAAGLTDHIWSVQELLAFPVGP